MNICSAKANKKFSRADCIECPARKDRSRPWQNISIKQAVAAKESAFRVALRQLKILIIKIEKYNIIDDQGVPFGIKIFSE